MGHPKILTITQARYGSSRLPGKVLMQLGGVSMLQMHLERASRARIPQTIMLATSTHPTDDAIAEHARKLNYEVSRGSLQDVLARFYEAAKPYNPDYVVRLTADCPLIDPQLIDLTILFCLANGLDYATNAHTPSYPNGFDVEVCTFAALEKAHLLARLASEREHVMPFIWKNSTLEDGTMFRAAQIGCPFPQYADLRLTVDNPEDHIALAALVQAVGTTASWLQYADYVLANPGIRNLNQHIRRNEGYAKSVAEDTEASV